jgi:S-formylglutathione hydrolase FrmB
VRLERPSFGRPGFAGRAELCLLESDLLRGNPLGDPHLRELAVYLPPGHDAPGARFPVLYLLAGFGGRGQAYLEPHPWRRSVAQTFDAAVAAGQSAPAVLVMPDCFTALGGSQYVNSSATGPYADHLLHEVLPLVDAHLPVLPGARAVLGKSSGGFGALHLALHHPGPFRAVASISGDLDFERTLAPTLLAALRGLVPYGLDPTRFLAEARRGADLGADEHAAFELLALAACYSPNPAAPLGFDLPLEMERGELRPEVWRRWLEFDPLHAVQRRGEALLQLDLLHLECGLRDEYHLQWGLRRLVQKLIGLGIPHVHEEHAGGHRGTDDRYGRLLPRFAALLGAPSPIRAGSRTR